MKGERKRVREGGREGERGGGRWGMRKLGGTGEFFNLDLRLHRE